MLYRTAVPLILTLVLGLTTTANARDPNLLGYWKLDETIGNVANDSSGNRKDGTLIGGVDWAPAQGKFGGAVRLGGTKDSCIEVSQEVINAAGTVALWARLTATQPREKGQIFIFGYASNSPRRIQLFMNDDNTQLDLGLGRLRWLHQNIENLKLHRWYHIALTWDGKNYAVYINGTRKAAGTHDRLNYSRDSYVVQIGNHAKDKNAEIPLSRHTFYGLIDDVAIFDRPLGGNEIAVLSRFGCEAFTSEPFLLTLFNAIKEAKAIRQKQKPHQVIIFLEKKIAELESTRESHVSKFEAPIDALFSDLYFLMAKAKEDAGLPKQDVVAAYEQALFSSERDELGKTALVRLFEYLSATRYERMLRHSVRSNTDEYQNIVEQFVAGRNWSAFEIFLNVLLSETPNPVSAAMSIEHTLLENKIWAQEYLDYCMNKVQLNEYVFEKNCKVAEQYINQERFDEAIEKYRELMKQNGSGRYGPLLELKVCKCRLMAGQYKDAIAELNQFISTNKDSAPRLTEQAVLIKGQCYIQLGQIDEALQEFLALTTKHPQAQMLADAHFYAGYCYMLQNKSEQAAEELRLVVLNYPQSSCAGKARMCLSLIGNVPSSTGEKIITK